MRDITLIALYVSPSKLNSEVVLEVDGSLKVVPLFLLTIPHVYYERLPYYFRGLEARQQPNRTIRLSDGSTLTEERILKAERLKYHPSTYERIERMLVGVDGSVLNSVPSQRVGV